MVTSFCALTLLMSSGPAFIEDDYPRALSQAKKEKKLLLVDAWAPWCHTCIFMREHVLNGPDFEPFSEHLVFASIDTEKAKSAAFLEKFPVNVWPTFFFIDPKSEKVVFKWIGSADAEQMKALLTAARGTATPLAEADHLLASGGLEEAAERYRSALKAGVGDASTRATLSMLSALALSKKSEPCARTAVEYAPELSLVSDRINAVSWGLGCALELSAEAPEGEKLRSELVSQAKVALKLPGAMADDVSGLYELLVEERSAAKDSQGRAALAAEWLTYLEEQAARAKTPAARAVFDPHRVSAALALSEPARAEAALLQSEKDFPRDYNPPARLAVVYREAGRLDEALSAIDRALAKCHQGPRKLRLYDTKASVLEKKGDQPARRRVQKEALAYARKLPKAQMSPKRLADLEANLQ